ncbi:hypothetical protein IGI67_002613 [Enterococcus sp. AZ196]
MCQVLLLTKNMMSEQSIKSKLQHLNYEVYCSTNVIEKLKSRSFTKQFLIQFPIIILSETIPNLEILDILNILRRGYALLFEKIRLSLQMVCWRNGKR